MFKQDNKQSIALLLAFACTTVLVLMAGLSGFQRGGSETERWLWVAASCLIVVVVHLLPALISDQPLLKSLPVWVVWLGGFGFVIFAHSQFFTLAEIHAGQERIAAQGIVLDDNYYRPAAPAPGERPITAIAAELSRATRLLNRTPASRLEGQKQLVATLERELSIAQETARQQTADKQRTESKISSIQDDPVAHRLAELLGIRHDVIMLGASLFMAFVLELVSVILWRFALRTPIDPVAAQAALAELTRDKKAKAQGAKNASVTTSLPANDESYTILNEAPPPCTSASSQLKNRLN